MTQKRTLLTIESLAELASGHQPPCLSLYQPTHRHGPENQQDPIRFRHLVKELETSLRQKYPAVETPLLVEPFEELARDHTFWNHTLDGLAVLGGPSLFQYSSFSGRSSNWPLWPTAFTQSPCDAFCNRSVAIRSLD